MSSFAGQFLARDWQQHALDAIRSHPSVALIGPPGSGKSTVAAWALGSADADSAVLLVTPSGRSVENVLGDVDAPAALITNRLLREAWWSTDRRPRRAVASPTVLASSPSVRRLLEASWDLLIL